MKIEIIATGSGGNCFVFDDEIMIDAGVSYKKLTEAIDVKKISHVLLSHIHGDHFKPETIRKLFVNTEIIFVCGEFLKDELLGLGVEDDRIFIISSGFIHPFGLFRVTAVLAYHDVENFGYRLMKKGYRHFHITDTSTLDGIDAINYDSASIECNHDRTRALEMIEEAKESGEFTHLKRATETHLSVQETIQFCKDNAIKKLIPIHIGNSTRKEVIEALKMF